ncbi:MAG TPA: hypothetical protein VH765_15935 [Xanthobacteraceae bacterium]|jgi:cytochrome c2
MRKMILSIAAGVSVALAVPSAAQSPDEAVTRGSQAYRLCAACHSL